MSAPSSKVITNVDNAKSIFVDSEECCKPALRPSEQVKKTLYAMPGETIAYVDPIEADIWNPECLFCVTESGCEWTEICKDLSDMVCVDGIIYYTWRPKGITDDVVDQNDPGLHFNLTCTHDAIGPRITVFDLIEIISLASIETQIEFLQFLVDNGLIELLIDSGLIQALIDVGLIQLLIDNGLLQELINAGLLEDIIDLIVSDPRFCTNVENCVMTPEILDLIFSSVVYSPLFCGAIRACINSISNTASGDPAGTSCSDSYLADPETGCITHICIGGVWVCYGSSN